MPELPDIAVYIECLERRIAGHTLDGNRVGHSFLVRTLDEFESRAARPAG